MCLFLAKKQTTWRTTQANENANDETLFLHPIHTYDNSGRVHVETTKDATAKLGFFFEIWGEEFSSEKIMGYSVNETHNLEMTVNEQKVDTFEETILEPLIEIEITYKKIDWKFFLPSQTDGIWYL